MRDWGLRGALALLLGAMLVACGGGAGFGVDTGDDGGDGGDGGDGTTTMTVDSLTLLASSVELPADADTSDEGITLTAVARDSSNNVVSGVTLTFAATSGELQVTTATTTDDGRGTAILTTAGNTTLRTITVIVNGGGQTASLQIQVVSPSSSNDPVYRLGTITGGTFTSGQITIGQTPLAAGGSSGLSLSIVDTANDNTLYTDEASVTFSSTCIANGLASVSPNPATASNGNVSATYVALGCSGNDTIRATTTIGGQSLTATGTIEVLPATLGSIEFVSAEPETIGLRGSGQEETATVVFRVVNSSGGPVANQSVDFFLNTDVGGIVIEPATGTTDSEGLVQTVVQAGTVHTTVRVTATATQDGKTISSQSEILVISTGLPDQDSFSLSAECFNLEALNTDGVEAEITIRAADRFNNPVPDGTAVAFTTEGGSIEGGCTTTGGACSVTWTSQNPRPVGFNGCDASNTDDRNGTDADCSIVGTLGASRPGRATVLATALGEESFTDLNGNGLFDETEPFDDLAEAWRDDDGDGVYDPSFEEFADYIVNGMRDEADGFFNGILCSDNPNCAPVGQRTISTRGTVTMVMSGSSPVIQTSALSPDVFDSEGTYDGSGFTVEQNQQFVAYFVVRDSNSQPMPSGTVIAASVAGDGGSIEGPDSYSVPCTIDDTRAGNTWGFVFKADEIDPGEVDGFVTLLLTVTSPSGLVSTYSFGVTILAP